MLLPDTIADAPARDYWLAIDSLERSVAGAISFRDNGVTLENVRLHVVPGRQRTGIGTLLLEEVIREAAQRGRSKLAAYANAAREPALHSFFSKIGFNTESKLFTAESGIHTAMEYLRRVRERAVANHRDPESVEIVPLSNPLLSDAGRLYAEYIANLPDSVSGCAYFSADISQFHLTQLLLVDGAVQGMVLMSQHGETATVHARIVREQYRRGWSSAVLLGRAIERAQQAGIQRLRFHFFDTTSDTLQLVKRLNMPIVECVDRFSLALPAA